jgi:hypothetical protein
MGSKSEAVWGEEKCKSIYIVISLYIYIKEMRVIMIFRMYHQPPFSKTKIEIRPIKIESCLFMYMRMKLGLLLKEM